MEIGEASTSQGLIAKNSTLAMGIRSLPFREIALFHDFVIIPSIRKDGNIKAWPVKTMLSGYAAFISSFLADSSRLERNLATDLGSRSQLGMV